MVIKKVSPSYSLQTLKKGLMVLELIAESKHTSTLTQLSVRLGEPVSVVFRLLKTLEELGYVEQDSHSKGYGLGLRVWEIGERALACFDIVDVAKPILSKLTNDTGDSSSFAVLRGHSFVYIATQEGNEPLRAYVEPGSRQPLTLPTASGRAILAFSPPELADEVFALDMLPYTPLTITDVVELRKTLRQIRRAGVAVVHGEYQMNLSAVSAPVFDAEHKCLGALAVSGLTQRFEGPLLEHIVDLVKSAAEDLSKKASGGRARYPATSSAPPAVEEER